MWAGCDSGRGGSESHRHTSPTTRQAQMRPGFARPDIRGSCPHMVWWSTLSHRVDGQVFPGGPGGDGHTSQTEDSEGESTQAMTPESFRSVPEIVLGVGTEQ